MIRRDVVNDRDQRVVKWSLLAAAFALTVGFMAETALERHVEDASTVAEQEIEAKAPRSSLTAAVTG
ncbi:hypothetical protein BH23GEM9_BH23GEM9_07310 [soil metagenome]